MNKGIKQIFRAMPVLYTKRLILRKMEKGDYRDMYDYAKSPSLTKYLTWEPHPDEGYTAKYLSYIQSKYRQGEFFDWAVIYNGKMIGTCGFTAIDEYNLCGEIGYVISEKYQNCGFATEAVLRVIDFGFSSLSLHRIEARYMDGNSASRRVMEKAGMTYEGTLRESLYVKGEYVSVAICSITKNEYYEKNSV